MWGGGGGGGDVKQEDILLPRSQQAAFCESAGGLNMCGLWTFAHRSY